MQTPTSCFLTGASSKITKRPDGRDGFTVTAPFGQYSISRSLVDSDLSKYDNYRHIFASIIYRYNQKGLDLDIKGSKHLDELLDTVAVPSTPMDQVDRIIQFIGSALPTGASYVTLHLQTDYPIAFAKDPIEFRWQGSCRVLQPAKSTGIPSAQK